MNTSLPYRRAWIARPALAAAVWIAWMLLAAPLAVAGDDEAKGGLLGRSVREVVAGITLETVDGDKVRLDTYLGKGPVIFDFWATWCKPCLAAMPELQALYDDLRDRGLQVVGINEDGPRNAAKVKPFLQTNGYTFPVVLDLNRQAQRRLNALALPTTLVLDSAGRVVHSAFGFRPGEIDKLRDIVVPLLPAETDGDD